MSVRQRRDGKSRDTSEEKILKNPTVDDSEKEEEMDFLDDPDEEEDIDFLDDPDEEEDIDFLDDPDEEDSEGDNSEEENSEETDSEETDPKEDSEDEDPDEDDSKEDDSEDEVSEEEDSDEDDLDADDIDVSQLLAEKEAYQALKRERREQRKQKVRAFFGRIKNFSIKDTWEKRSDVIDFVQDKVRNIGKEKEKEKEEEGELDLAAKIKIQQNKNRIRMTIISTVAVLCLLGYGIYRQVRVFHTMKPISVQQRQDDNATEYVNLKRYVLKCNPNGVTCVNKKNEVIWNTTFTMQSPLVDKCGDIVAIGSQRGNEIYLFKEDGLLSSFTVEHVLTKMKVTKQGDVAVVLEDGQVTWINVYDKWGKLLIRNKTTMPESGYPMDMDISPNGYKMMVSFLGVDEDIESRIAFYNFSAVGQDSEGKLVNEDIYSGSVIPEVKFMDGNYAVAFSDHGVTVFRGQQIPEECNRINIDQEIISEFNNDQYFGFVTESDEEDHAHKYKIVVYRENGSKRGSMYTNFEYTNIEMSEKQIILYNNTSMRIFSVSGKLLFSGNYNKQILKVIPTTSSRRFNILTDDSVDLIKIK